MDNIILKFLQEVLHDEFIKNEELLINYNLDSMELIYLFVQIENEFNIEIPNESLIYTNYKSFGDIIRVVEKQISFNNQC